MSNLDNYIFLAGTGLRSGAGPITAVALARTTRHVSYLAHANGAITTLEKSNGFKKSYAIVNSNHPACEKLVGHITTTDTSWW